ncbi:ricin-type beta-trefoil lectin domain protein [Actinoplanes sp. NPDC048796]|uniref:ricin-type beta-trefoil lectin domain protein n=1 Tax=Actinoplanes sp. NPDC048796 TaxID=3155640 RepID=UPI0033EEE142
MTSHDGPREDGQGVPVPGRLMQTIPAAAQSCPTLTPARLAAQVMEASRFELDGENEGSLRDIAGLSDEVWQAWRPSESSERTDPGVAVVALARHMCDLSGQVRAAGLDGDEWQLALAAHETGLDSVRAAGGVPEEARSYVMRVSAYAEWYARQPGLAPAPDESSELGDAGAKAKKVPAEYVAAVSAAGRRCGAVTPARVAGQLMAASGFDPRLTGPDGGQGIAQFLPSIWKQYAPAAPGASPQEPQAAIAALGAVMCTLVDEFKDLGSDPYDLALAAFRRGPDAVKREGKMPDSADLRQLVAQVDTYAAVYQGDNRLSASPSTSSDPVTRSNGPSARPAPSGASPRDSSLLAAGPAQPVKGPQASPAAGGTTSNGKPPASKPGTSDSTPTKPAAIKPPPAQTATVRAVSGAGSIVEYATGRCLDVTDGAYGSNPQLQIWDCNGGPNQAWTLYSDGTIRAFNRCMTAQGANTQNGTKIILSTCTGGAAQRFTLNSSHDLVNVSADRCVDVIDKNAFNGAKLQLWDCAGTDNQKWSR